MKRLLFLLFACALAVAQYTPPPATSAIPSGPCGNDLGGTYPNCTVIGQHFSVPLAASAGGSGVNNGSFTETRSGNVTYTGAFNPTFAIPATGTYSLAVGTEVVGGNNCGTSTQVPFMTSAGTIACSANLTYAAGLLNINDGTQGFLIGAYTGASGYGAMYLTGTTPANGNFILAANSTETVFNSIGGSGGTVTFDTGGIRRGSFVGSTGFYLGAGTETNLNKNANGIIAFGTTTNNSAGGWVGTSGQWLNPVAVGSLAACAAGTLGQRVEVSDATVATPGSTAVGSGTFTVSVQCIKNSTGNVFTWIID